jgi:hypothetical protein
MTALRTARSTARRLELLFVGVLTAACAANPGTSWKVRRAEQLHAEGRHEDALRLTEQEIAWGSTAPSPSLVELHIEILRALGRQSEADAYFRFADRYFTGEETDDSAPEISQRSCERNPGYDLIRSFGRPEQRNYEIGRVVVTFELDDRGRIGEIDVLSARDPASAWAGIDRRERKDPGKSIGRAPLQRSAGLSGPLVLLEELRPIRVWAFHGRNHSRQRDRG